MFTIHQVKNEAFCKMIQNQKLNDPLQTHIVQ